MSPKQKLLDDVAQALADQTISRQDLESLLPPMPGSVINEPAEASAMTQPISVESPAKDEAKPKNGVGVIEILFYLAGIILFAALMTMVTQLGENALASKLVVSVGAGLMFWTGAYVLAKQAVQNDTKQGLINSMLLTGSLSVIAGVFIATIELLGDGNDEPSSALIYAAILAALGAAHAAFDRLLRNPILAVFGLILFVASFPTAITGILADAGMPPDVWGLVAIITGGLLAFGGRILASSAEGREDYKGSFESIAGFIILASIYTLGFNSYYPVFWQLILPFTIYTAFFISIKRRSKQFLLTGSLFLVLFLITISFKYFQGLGAAFSLVLSAFSILGTAFVASNINKKYLKA